MSVSINRDHPAVPRPQAADEKSRFCESCGERLFITLKGFWAHPHTFVAPIPAVAEGSGSFCEACAIFRGSVIHQV